MLPATGMALASLSLHSGTLSDGCGTVSVHNGCCPWNAIIFVGYEVNGMENIPDEGPALIVGYHGTLPIDLYYLIAKAILFKNRTIHCVADKAQFWSSVPSYSHANFSLFSKYPDGEEW